MSLSQCLTELSTCGPFKFFVLFRIRSRKLSLERWWIFGNRGCKWLDWHRLFGHWCNLLASCRSELIAVPPEVPESSPADSESSQSPSHKGTSRRKRAAETTPVVLSLVVLEDPILVVSQLVISLLLPLSRRPSLPLASGLSCVLCSESTPELVPVQEFSESTHELAPVREPLESTPDPTPVWESSEPTQVYESTPELVPVQESTPEPAPVPPEVAASAAEPPEAVVSASAPL
ncbi:E3 ubiquitin-protein ligase RNF12-B-like [Onychostoma macrolepis]|uniref:E3 ubiquitin-protein ligase RNF12-B-like n=1 Tax=Onychostoma macrolepis TaxID=369639 RepID=UPI00272A56BC|nr:E3 ubiquitin-protein ligase RNF12-B-like [Onychostoma macrolepis]